MNGAIQWRVPESVLRVLHARFDELNRWPERQPVDLVDEIDRELYLLRKRELFGLLVKIRNCAPAAIRACEQFDRGEIREDELLRIGVNLRRWLG